MGKAKLMENWPKKMPKWNAKYPCPKSVTLYLSAVTMTGFKKDFPIPPFPDFNTIFKEYNDAQIK